MRGVWWSLAVAGNWLFDPQRRERPPFSKLELHQHEKGSLMQPTNGGVVFDIETAGLDDEIVLSRCKPFDATKIKHPGEFRETDVKLGNLKDPKKIAEKIEAKRAEHQSRLESFESDLAAAQAEWRAAEIERAALSPSTGRILAAGILRPGFEHRILEGEETGILNAFWRCVMVWRKDGLRLIGHQSNRFDVPFLIRRSWLLGVTIPDGLFDRGRYLIDLFVDLGQVWACGTGDWVSLDSLAKAFGVGSKNGDGAEFAKLYREDRPAAIAYLKNDLDLTAAVAGRMGVL